MLEQTGTESFSGLEIAVIGMAGKFPGANNITQFWQNLINGVESISFFSDDELLAEGVNPEMLKNPAYVKAGGFIDDKMRFDSFFFGYSLGEAEIMVPQMRIFHECVWSAFEDAGYVPASYPGKIGIYAGASSSSYWEMLVMLSYNSESQNALAAAVYIDKDQINMRISYNLNLSGPAVTINTACSTSLVAIHMACQGILSGDCDMALAGGCSLNGLRKAGYLYMEGGIYSPDGHCRSFDAGANGAVTGEGIGVVLLKPLTEAMADHDYIYAVIKGSAINNDGRAKVGYTAPSVQGQVALISGALRAAGVSSKTIGYIETHGTGSSIGDPIEFEALKTVFGTDNKKVCAMGSVETNIGHLIDASGVARFIKTVLALKHRVIPPTLHFKNPNPKLDMENSPFYMVTGLTPWHNTNGPLRAGVSAFGIGGTNAHVILEEAPHISQSKSGSASPVFSPKSPHLILLSAKTPSARQRLCENLAAYLKNNPDSNLADVAYTLQVGREHFPYRQIVVGDNNDQIADLLTHAENQKIGTVLPGETEPLIVFMFPGEGSQHTNMGLDLYQTEAVFREEMNRCFNILRSLMNIDIKEVIYPSSESQMPAMNRAEIALPVLFSFEYSLAKLLLKWGIKPYAMIGHSLGEYTAACLAGVFSLEDGLNLAVTRGRLLQQVPGGDMLGVPVSVEQLKLLLEEHGDTGISIAAVNSLAHCVVSGLPASITQFETFLKEKGLDSHLLHLSHGFNSKMMEPILSQFGSLTGKLKLNIPQIPYISNLTGHWLTDGEATNPSYFVDHLRRTVRFADGIKELLAVENKNIVFVEVGPGNTLSTFVKPYADLDKKNNPKNNRQIVNLVRPLQDPGTADAGTDCRFLLEQIGSLWLAGHKIEWTSFNQDEKRQRIPLPTYPFEGQFFCLDDHRLLANFKNKNLSTLSKPDLAGEPGEEKKLPASMYQRPHMKTEYAAPGSDLEKTLARVWEKFFSIEGLGIHDDFFELGGDSLKATVLASRIHKEVNVKLPLREFFKAPTIQGLAAYITRAKENTFIPIEPAEEKEYYALNPSQKRLYILQQLVPDNTGYNMPYVIPLGEHMEIEKLTWVFKSLTARHESLRTCFITVNGEAVQKIHKEVAIVIHSANTSGEEAEKVISNFVEPFDLSKAPLMRVKLVTVDSTRQILLIDMHHIITDGISQNLLTKEFMTLYPGAELPPLRLQYKDYSEWQNREEQSLLIKEQERYWLEMFSGEVPVLNLPIDFPRPVMQSFEGNNVNFYLTAKDSKALKELAKHTGATVYMCILSVFTILLSKLGGQEDIVVGTPIAARRHADLEKIIGMFVNTLAMRNAPSGYKSYLEFLLELKEHTLKAYENQEYQFEELVNKISVSRDTGRNPLFDVLFNLLNIDEYSHDIPESDEEEKNQLNHRQGTAKFDVTLTAVDLGERFLFTIEYCSRLFKPETINRFISYFKKLCYSLATAPELKLFEMEIIFAEEKQHILNVFNAPGAHYPTDMTIHRLFEEQVERLPDNIAIVGQSSITYRELNEKSNRLAHALRQNGVKPDTIVGLMVERSLEMMAGILGILKAGGAYLPIDPAYPQERVDFMLQDSGAKILVKKSGTPLSFAAPFVLDFEHLNFEFVSNFDIRASNLTPANLAYIIYTSGTTGKPKGVLIEHVNVVRLLFNDQFQFDFNERDVWTLFHSYSFDFSVWEMYGALLYGGRLVVIPRAITLDPARFLETVKQERVTVLNQTPSAFYNFINEELQKASKDLKLRYVIFGGDALKPGKLKEWYEKYPHTRLVNMYGITETTVHVTYKEIGPDDIAAESKKIGGPIPTLNVYIMDRFQRLMPVGAAGELCVGGAGVARGYLNRPELTAERFVGNPYKAGDRLYKSGDLGRLITGSDIACGDIEYLGRIDQQVKIRGFRVELGEIESLLLKHENIKEAVVVIKKMTHQAETNETADNYLCAYFVSHKELSLSELKEYLARQLPGHMIPSYFLQLDKIPLTANGKVDKKALELLGKRLAAGTTHVPPRSDIEKKLAEAWKKVLKLDEVSIHDNFFDLGGVSMDVIHLNNQLKEALNIDISVATLYRYMTISSFAQYLTEEESCKHIFEQKIDRAEEFEMRKVRVKQKLLRRGGANESNQ